MEPNVAAALSYLLGFITGIIFILVEKENRFVRFHAWQSIFFSVALCIVNIVVGSIPVVNCFVSPVLLLGGLVLWIVLMVKAYQGEKFKLPVIGDISEKQN